ncbi:MAG: sensor histidine kinase [Chloroflexota bacterium]
MVDFFTRNIILVYFFYGLAFFCMGFAILLETGRASTLDFAQALRPLAFFGLIHGGHEWFEMFLLVDRQNGAEAFFTALGAVRLGLLAISFFLLLSFGLRLLFGADQLPKRIFAIGTMAILWLFGLGWMAAGFVEKADWLLAADVYTRYSLAIPGSLLVARGLLVQRSKFFAGGMMRFGQDVALAALAFFLYGCIGQLFASPSSIFPSPYFNTETFLEWFGVPIQVFRAAMAAVAAAAIIRSLRAFVVETNRKIEALRTEQSSEQHRLEELRAALLHQTVKAQESERQRIARELHDELGQTLTALGMGLRSISDNLSTNPERAGQQATQLEKLVKNGIEALQNLVTGLHPPQLDDLGLLAALRWYTNEFSSRYGLQVRVNSSGNLPVLPEEVRVALYRIVQEATTNAARHAEATQVNVQLIQSNHDIILQIEDNGGGFDVDETFKKQKSQPCWGLFGMIERAELINGTCLIASSPGHGTLIEVTVPIRDLKEHS